MLFAVGGLRAAPSDLAFELFAEGDWPAATLECRRVLRSAPGDATARALQAAVRLREGGSPGAAAMTELHEVLRDPTVPAAVVAAAALEAGRQARRAGDPAAAFRWLGRAFEIAGARDEFERSGAALAGLLQEHPELSPEHSSLRLQLDSCARLWRADRGAPPDGGARLAAKPVEWIVALYRHGAAPAIGARCSLSPSCSRYFLQAGREHGLLAFPMMGDRLVREPSVVARGRPVVIVNGKERIADPLSDHWTWRGEAPR